MNSRNRRKKKQREVAAKANNPVHNSENIKHIFERALEEEDPETTEILPPESESASEVINPLEHKQRSTRKLFFILGIFVLIMSVVGIFSTGDFVAQRVRDFADNTAQKNEFAAFIYPIVICDPPPFDLTVKMRNETVISAAIWDIILYDDKSVYTQEFDTIIVPDVTVESHAIKLFGDGLSIDHQSVVGTEVQFYYDPDQKTYRIPANPRYFTYSPFIESITKVGERYTLMVGYLSPTPSWYTMNEQVPMPEKYAEYVVSKRGDSLQLVAISQVDNIGTDSGL
jgi:hypothetical protein